MSRIERRYKFVYISGQQVLNCFGTSDAEYVPRIFFPTLPADVQTIGAHYNHLRQCWEVILYHESFPIVPDNEFAPEIHASSEIRQVPLRKVEPRKVQEVTISHKGTDRVSIMRFAKPLNVLNNEMVSVDDLNGKFLVKHHDTEGNLLSSQECENKIVQAEEAKRTADSIRYEKAQLQSWRDKPSQL